MTISQALGSFLGLAGGAIFGALLFSGQGTFGYGGGAVGGGFAGMRLGVFVGHFCHVVYAFARAIAIVYWEVLTGRRKLPSTSTASERRHLTLFIGIVFAVSLAILGSYYLFGSVDQRTRTVWCAGGICLTYAIGHALLSAHYRHTPPADVTGEEP